ncbi:hypothetical protein Ancab_030843 [Ancistrocladus abbreviatus]
MHRFVVGLVKGRSVCCQIISSSFYSSSPLGLSHVSRRESSKKLSNFFKLGEIENAEKMFNEMPERDIFAWSIMIHGYAKNGLHKQSLELFSIMRQRGFFPNSFTIVGALLGLAGLRDVVHVVLAQCVHGLVVKCGLESNSVVATALLDAYAKCGDLIGSNRLFEEMDNPSLVSCNALIAGLVHNELLEDAVRLFIRLRRSGLEPSSATMLTVIQGCVSLELQTLCKSMHTLVVKFGLVVDTPVSNSILGMYSSLSDLDAAEKVFDGMECKDVISWTTMVGLLNDLEYASDALKVFQQMRDYGVSYDMVSTVNLIRACTILKDFRRGKQVHAQALICGFASQLTVLNSLITMYAECGVLHGSRAVFDGIAEKSLVSWSAIISGYAQNGHPKDAVGLLIKLRTEENCCFDLVILLGALRAAGELALLELCKQLHCYVFQAGFPRYRRVMNSLVTAYSKSGNSELALDVFSEMDHLRDAVSWNAMLNGMGINGHGRTAVDLFYEMQRDHEAPDSATYLSVLNACSHSGLVDVGLKIFEQMIQENKIIPSQEHFGCIIDMLARAGCLSDLSQFITRFMEEMGPNAWRALLSGCLLHGNMMLADFAAKRITALDPEDPGQAVLLSNTLASVGRFQDAEALRLSIGKKGLIKHPGISLVN